MDDTLYIRHVWTNSLKRTLEGLVSGDVLKLVAHRTYGKTTDTNRPYNWVLFKESDVVLIQMDFLSLFHGQFNKKAVLDLLIDPRIEDAPVHELDIHIGKGPIGKAFAEMRKDDSFLDRNYVAHFEEYPIRREPEKNKFTKDARDKFEGFELGKLGFEPATLDLKYVLPIENWREIIRGRISQQRQVQFDAFKGDFLKCANSDVRNLALSVFSKDLCSARVYKRMKGDVWTLVQSGDI